MEQDGAAPKGEEGAWLRVVIYKLIVRVLRFVAKLDDGSERQVAEHDVEFEVNMKHFSVEKLIELIRSKITWGVGQDVRQDKHFESVERIDSYWKLLTAFLERWEEKELLVLAMTLYVTTSYATVSKAMQRAKDEIYGSWGSSFRYLFNFKAEIELRSPGTIVEVDTKLQDDNVYFHRFFMVLKPCVDGFHVGCMSFLSIDSTALNGKWNGHLAACTALDGHNGMFPLAFGFIEVEDEDNWTWFMTQLRRALGPIPKLAISTDARKGLEHAVKKVFLQAEQRECFRHLMQNFSKRYRGDIIGRMWAAGKTYRPSMFEYHFSKVLESSETVGKYLHDYHNLKWMRSSFDTEIKCDYIHNNLAESFNSWIRGIKDLPVDGLADALNGKIMKLIEKRRKIGEKLHGKMLPAVVLVFLIGKRNVKMENYLHEYSLYAFECNL